MRTLAIAIIGSLMLAGAAAPVYAQMASEGQSLSTPAGQAQFFEHLQRDGG